MPNNPSKTRAFEPWSVLQLWVSDAHCDVMAGAESVEEALPAPHHAQLAALQSSSHAGSQRCLPQRCLRGPHQPQQICGGNFFVMLVSYVLLPIMLMQCCFGGMALLG